MFFLAVTETVNITKEIPPAYLAGFAAVMAVVLFAVSRYLTHLFIPKGSDDEAPVWSRYDEKK